MNTRIDDALDVIEFDTQNERTTLCRKQEATLPGYISKMAAKLQKVIEKAIRKADYHDETVVRSVSCTDRLFLCFGDRITGVRIMVYPKGSIYISIDWASFIRDHKLQYVAGHQLAGHLNARIDDYHAVSSGEAFNHEFEFVLVKASKGKA